MTAISNDRALSRAQLGLASPLMNNESQTPDSKRSPVESKPWPMWPIAVSILSFMVFYTWFQFTFRKTEKPYEPSRAMQEGVIQAAEKNLYDWYSLAVTQISPISIAESATIIPKVRGELLENELPSQIVYYLPRKPILIPKTTGVNSDLAFRTAEPLTIALEMPEAFANSPLFRLTALYKEGDLILLAEMRVENEASLVKLSSEGGLKTLHLSIDTQPIATEKIAVQFFTAEKTYHWQVEQLKEGIPFSSES